MNDQAANVAVAEFCGHRATAPRIIAEGTGLDTVMLCSGVVGSGGYSIPDYGRDLNAIHEAESRLSEDDWSEYYRRLHIVTRPKNYKVEPGCDEHTKAFIHATASQRREALLRAIGKWEP